VIRLDIPGTPVGCFQSLPDYSPISLGARTIVADLAQELMWAPFVWFALLFILFVLRVLLRKQWAAATAWVLLLFTVLASGDRGGWVSALIFSMLAVFVMIRFGLHALVVNHVVFSILQHFPLTTQGSARYEGIGLTGILLIGAIGLYGFYTSLGGRADFGRTILEE
jgi:hypothetical protein